MDRMEALVNTIIVERDGWKREALELRQDRADALRMVLRERERCLAWLAAAQGWIDAAEAGIESGEWPPEEE